MYVLGVTCSGKKKELKVVLVKKVIRIVPSQPASDRRRHNATQGDTMPDIATSL